LSPDELPLLIDPLAVFPSVTNLNCGKLSLDMFMDMFDMPLNCAALMPDDVINPSMVPMVSLDEFISPVDIPLKDSIKSLIYMDWDCMLSPLEPTKL
jgi:hypothetical protein